MIEIRKGQAPARLVRAQFSVRFRASFIDPAFRAEDQSIARLEALAWQADTEGRKAGDVAGIEGSRRALSDWLDWMGFIDADAQSQLDRYIGMAEEKWNRDVYKYYQRPPSWE